jgi:hypothetical protein
MFAPWRLAGLHRSVTAATPLRLDSQRRGVRTAASAALRLARHCSRGSRGPVRKAAIKRVFLAPENLSPPLRLRATMKTFEESKH